MIMSFTELETQALGSIADGLAGSDPRLASMLTIFSRLAAGEEMPAREKTRVRVRGFSLGILRAAKGVGMLNSDAALPALGRTRPCTTR
jgi:hypothetical protein